MTVTFCILQYTLKILTKNILVFSSYASIPKQGEEML